MLVDTSVPYLIYSVDGTVTRSSPFCESRLSLSVLVYGRLTL